MYVNVTLITPLMKHFGITERIPKMVTHRDMQISSDFLWDSKGSSTDWMTW